MVIRVTVLFFAVLFSFPMLAAAQEYVTYVLGANETVSLAALKLTRNAANWNKPGVVVVNPETGRTIRNMRRVPVGAHVRVPKQLVRTAIVAVSNNQTATSLCAQYVDSGCRETIVRVNSLVNATAALPPIVYVPATFVRRIDVVVPPTTRAQAETTESVAGVTGESREDTSGFGSVFWVSSILVLIALGFAGVFWGLPWIRRRNLRRQQEQEAVAQAVAIVQAECLEHFQYDPDPPQILARSFYDRGAAFLRLGNPFGTQASVGESGLLRERLDGITRRHPELHVQFGVIDFRDGAFEVPMFYSPQAANVGGDL